MVDQLEKLVDFFLHKGYPILIVLNQGSTWKGAYDDVPAVNDMLVRVRGKRSLALGKARRIPGWGK